MNPENPGETADALRQRLLGRLARFVAIPSRSSPEGGEEGALQSLVAAEMRRTGARVRLVNAADLPAFFSHPLCFGPDREYRDRPTVIAEMGPAAAPALLVIAHSDTVPLYAPEAWTVDPFAATIDNGRLYGLGAADDKWGLATMITLMEELAGGGGPRKKLVFASTIDEENGVGNGLLLLMLAGIQAEAALYLDGGYFDILIGNLGGSHFYLEPVSPVDEATLAGHLARLAAACRQASAARLPLFTPHPYYRRNSHAGRSFIAERRRYRGKSCLMINFYTLPGETPAALDKTLERLVAEALGPAAAGYRRHYRRPWFEPSLAPPDTPLAEHLAAAATALSGRRPVFGTVSKQDAFIFNNHARIPTVSFGVARREGPGAFHQPDEYVTLDDAWRGFRIARETVGRWLNA